MMYDQICVSELFSLTAVETNELGKSKRKLFRLKYMNYDLMRGFFFFV